MTAYSKWSKQFDIRPHRRRTRTVKWYSPGGAKCTPSSTPRSASAPYLLCPLVSRFVYIYRRPLFALKIAPSRVGSGPPSNTWFPGPTSVSILNRVTIGSAAFAGFTVVTDRPTDRSRYSVCSNRPHLASAAMQPKKNKPPAIKSERARNQIDGRLQ